MSVLLRMWLAGAGAAIVLAACADDRSATEDPTVVDDGGVVPPVEVGPVEDASDAGEDASDAARIPRTCSDQGFCHTVVPADQTLRGVWGDGTGVVWAVSEQGAILRWEEASGWKVHATVAGALNAIWGSGPTDLWIGGEKGLFHGQGASSTALVFSANAAPGNTAIAITSIWGTGPNDVWAVGGKSDDDGNPIGRVVRFTGASTDAGATWTLDPVSSRPFAFTKVWGTAASGVWIGGAGSTMFTVDAAVFRRAATASAFARITTLPFDPLDGPEQGQFGDFTTGGTSGTDIWVAGKSKGFTPGFWRGTSANGGTTFTWSHVGRDLNDQRLDGIWGTGPNDAWAAGDYGRFRHWNGTKWEQAALMIGKFPVTAPLHALWGNSPTNVWVVGKGTAIHLDPTKAK